MKRFKSWLYELLYEPLQRMEWIPVAAPWVGLLGLPYVLGLLLEFTDPNWFSTPTEVGAAILWVVCLYVVINRADEY